MNRRDILKSSLTALILFPFLNKNSNYKSSDSCKDLLPKNLNNICSSDYPIELFLPYNPDQTKVSLYFSYDETPVHILDLENCRFTDAEGKIHAPNIESLYVHGQYGESANITVEVMGLRKRSRWEMIKFNKKFSIINGRLLENHFLV